MVMVMELGSCAHIRQFIESMKSLGYSGALSLESFRTPHFGTVAECIRWLVSRYDPEVQLDEDITTEEGRVAFLKSAAHIMFLKTRIKLNLRKLYSADSSAAGELLQVVSLLQQATAAAEAASEKTLEAEMTLFKKSFDVKAARSLVLDIIKAGATLYDDLATEMQLQKERSVAAATNTDIEQIESMVRDGTNTLLRSVCSVEQQQHSCEKDEKSLHATCEKRKMELERCKKRLSVLENVRPAYLDEYEALQKDLQNLFGGYLEKFHNLQWLESQLESHNHEEQEKLQESFAMMKRLQQRLHDENLQILRGEEIVGNEKQIIEPAQIEKRMWSEVNLKPLTLEANDTPVECSQQQDIPLESPQACKVITRSLVTACCYWVFLQGASDGSSQPSEANANEESTDDEF